MQPSYTVGWLPVPGALFSLPEIATNIAYNISCQVNGMAAIVGADIEPPEPPTVIGYSSDTNAPDIIDVANDSHGITVSASSLSGLFGIVFIDYQENRNTTRVLTWDDLPSSADEIIEFRPSGKTERAYWLKVTAHLSDGGAEAANYTMIINQDWTAGRDRLLEEMSARNNSIRR